MMYGYGVRLEVTELRDPDGPCAKPLVNTLNGNVIKHQEYPQTKKEDKQEEYEKMIWELFKERTLKWASKLRDSWYGSTKYVSTIDVYESYDLVIQLEKVIRVPGKRYEESLEVEKPAGKDDLPNSEELLHKFKSCMSLWAMHADNVKIIISDPNAKIQSESNHRLKPIKDEI